DGGRARRAPARGRRGAEHAGRGRGGGARVNLDPVDLKILQNHLVNICQEMAKAMMRTAYSPIFSESLDFGTILLDRNGEMLSIADMNPAMLGSGALSGKWIVEEHGRDTFEPGAVI